MHWRGRHRGIRLQLNAKIDISSRWKRRKLPVREYLCAIRVQQLFKSATHLWWHLTHVSGACILDSEDQPFFNLLCDERSPHRIYWSGARGLVCRRTEHVHYRDNLCPLVLGRVRPVEAERPHRAVVWSLFCHCVLLHHVNWDRLGCADRQLLLRRRQGHCELTPAVSKAREGERGKLLEEPNTQNGVKSLKVHHVIVNRFGDARSEVATHLDLW
mmetsp:Transcript_17495/g.48297  ORF Transcript_17495/g.48297 Transcript_17495/m.48297 type:complete len:215 (+) Transcript_17495:194-838(+)